jgi:hypothetical protein
MKRNINRVKPIIFIVIFTFILSIAMPYYKVTYAADAAEIKVATKGDTAGQVKAGSNIEISVDLANLTNFYAGSVDYTYDNTLLEVSSVEVNGNIKERNPFEAYNDVAKDGNRARYGFTFMSENEQGINGQSNFVTIKGKAKKDGQLNVGVQDMKFQLVQKVDGNISEMPKHYFDNGHEKYSVTRVKSSDGTKSQEKIELIAANESKDSSDEANKDQASTSDNSSEDKVAEGSDSMEQSFDESSGDSDSNDSEKQNADDKSHNTYLYIGLALVCMVIAATGSFVVYRKKRK